MPAAPLPTCEANRLKALARYNILDTNAEEAFDRVARIAKMSFDVPMALVSLVDRDRQWFKSHLGIEAEETPRDQAFCAHAILRRDVMVVEDASQDDRFRDNPLVTGQPFIRFYAGAPIVTQDDFALGTLCVIDTKPRAFDDADAHMLRDLAAMAMNEFELRVAGRGLDEIDDIANRDTLTDAFNGRTFNRLLAAETLRARQQNRPLQLAVFEATPVQSFRLAAKKAAMVALHDICSETVRPQDIVGRIDRSRLSVLFPNTADDAAEIIVRRILKKAADAPLNPDTPANRVTAGLARLDEGCDAKGLLQPAADALGDTQSAQLAC
ncbi:MAG: GAF domain-containing protein [Pseudomonadota bacterium]